MHARMQRADSGIVDRAYNHEQLHLLLDENTDTALQIDGLQAMAV